MATPPRHHGDVSRPTTSPYTCDFCPEPASKRRGTVHYCARHYWSEYGPILRRVFLSGIDPWTGNRVAPRLPPDALIGIGRFAWPASSWPPGHAMLICDICSAEWIGDDIGEFCSWCRDRAVKSC